MIVYVFYLDCRYRAPNLENIAKDGKNIFLEDAIKEKIFFLENEI